MPLYDYKCPKCQNEYELLLSLKEWDKITRCPKCGETGKKQLCLGVVLRDDPTWLEDSILQSTLQSQEDLVAKRVKPLETRQEFKRFLKDNHLTQGSNAMV